MHDSPRSIRRGLRAAIASTAVVAAFAGTLFLAPTAAVAATTPTVVAGSAASGFSGAPSVDFVARKVTIKSSNVQAGDLWLGIAAYDGDGGLTISGTGWNAPAPYNAGGPAEIYSTRAWVFWKVLTASDIVSGTFTATITTGADHALFGGARFAGVAYRGSNLTAKVAGSAVNQGAGTGSYADVTFPAVAPPSATNVIVRLGAARGYGGYLAGQPINWTSAPGTWRVSSNSGNTGDRALVISDEANGSGAAASGRYFTALWGNRARVTYSVAITSAA